MASSGNQYLWQTPPVCKGVNNTLPDILINDDELSDASNLEPDLAGQGWLRPRGGLTKVDSNSRSAQSWSVFGGILGNFYHNGTVVYNFAGTSVLTGMAAAVDSWASFASYDLFVNGTDAQKTANGTSFSAISNIPTGAKYICAVNNFLYCAGHNTNLGELRWASVGTAETWPTAYGWYLTKGNDNIIGLANWSGTCLALCNKSFHMVAGTTNINQKIVYSSSDEGCTASKSIVVTPYGVFWWSRPGIVCLKSDYTIDYPMKRKLAKTLSNLNRGQDANVHAAWDSWRGCVSFWVFNGAAQTTVNLRIDYYPALDAFFLHSGAGVAMACSASVVVSGVENIYVSGYNPTYLYKQSGLTDDGTLISWYFDTKREGNPSVIRQGRSSIVSTDLTGAETVYYACYPNYAVTAALSTGISAVANALDSYIATNMENTRMKHRVHGATSTSTRITQVSHMGTISKVR